VGKKINGRKRHILVDVMGLPLAVVVPPANIRTSQRQPVDIRRLDDCVAVAAQLRPQIVDGNEEDIHPPLGGGRLFTVGCSSFGRTPDSASRSGSCYNAYPLPG
jgi:hypothetical protein